MDHDELLASVKVKMGNIKEIFELMADAVNSNAKVERDLCE